MKASVALLYIVLALSFQQLYCFLPQFGRALKISKGAFPLRISTTEFKTGVTFEIDGHAVKLLEFLHVKPGKGAAFVRSKVKNLLTGTVQEKTFRAGESFNDVEIDRKDVQFSYTDGSEKCFMDMKTFEEIRISDNEIPNHKFLVEGMICTLARWGDVVIDVDLPLTYTYTVVGFPLTSKDSGGQKTATLDCGVTMYVPSFVHEGDKISVNIEKREYAGRA